MNPLDLLFGQIRGAIENHASPNTPGPAYDSGGILGQLAGLFGGHAQETGQQFGGYNQSGYDQSGYNQGGYQGGVLPSSQDPYGDPADLPNAQQTGHGGVLPSSQDPFGDPADQGR